MEVLGLPLELYSDETKGNFTKKFALLEVVMVGFPTVMSER